MKPTDVILITGSSKGLGLGLVAHYLKIGCRVIGCSRGSDSPINHDQYQHYQVDVSSESAVKAMFKDIKKQTEKLNLVVNNAAISNKQYIIGLREEDISEVLSINTMGSMLIAKYAYKTMRKSKKGNIINISSIHVPLAMEGAALYAASKAAIEQFTRSMAKETISEGIRVNSLALSVVDNTEMANDLDAATIEKILDQSITKKSVTLAEVIHAIDYLKSDLAAPVTGECLRLGGFQ